jgi:hypothetical protein
MSIDSAHAKGLTPSMPVREWRILIIDVSSSVLRCEPKIYTFKHCKYNMTADMSQVCNWYILNAEKRY